MESFELNGVTYKCRAGSLVGFAVGELEDKGMSLDGIIAVLRAACQFDEPNADWHEIISHCYFDDLMAVLEQLTNACFRNPPDGQA